MSIKIIREQEGVERKIADSHSTINLLTADHSDRMSIAIGIGENHDGTTTTASERAYYIPNGEITVDDTFVAKKGDVVLIPAGTMYSFRGSFRAVVVNSPPFRKDGA